MTIESPEAVRFSNNSGVTVGLMTCARAGEGLWVDVHAQELKLQSVEMGDVWDEVHEIRELFLS